MPRSRLRVRIGTQGELEVIDPGYDTLPLLQEVNSAFEIAVSQNPALPKGPGFQTLRKIGSGMPRQALSECPLSGLWRLHKALLGESRGGHSNPTGEEEASLLDLKAHIARRLLRRCLLCARRCAVDRSRAPAGTCRLGPDAFVAEHFVHIAEEAPINPSLVLNMNGCGLRCIYCQQHEILGRRSTGSQSLDAELWDQLDTEGARSMSFIGGNPDESLPAILAFLSEAPDNWALPVVWNNHAYSTDEVLQLLDGVVDVYVPDLKYMNDDCARSLSGIRNYASAARGAIKTMLGQGVPVIVRILVLPGHLECCHRPALQSLAEVNRELMRVSIRGQYSPDWRIDTTDGLLNGRVGREEMAEMRSYATRLGLMAV